MAVRDLDLLWEKVICVEFEFVCNLRGGVGVGYGGGEGKGNEEEDHLDEVH